MSLSGQQNTSSRVQPVMGNGEGVLVGMNGGNTVGTSKLMIFDDVLVGMVGG